MNKKSAFFTAAILSAALFTTGCVSIADNDSQNTGQEEAASKTALKGTFTNMGDEKSLQKVVTQLQQAGLPEADIAEFTEQVRSLNKVVPTGTLVTEPTSLAAATADDGTVSAATEKQPRLTNCRITVFTLANSLITRTGSETPNTSLLFVDSDQIDTSPALFTKNRDTFNALYGSIATTTSKDRDPRIADIEEYFASQGISFANSKVSVISVFVHDTLDDPAISFIGHTGILVDLEQKLLFVEKLAFDAPYRAIEFNNRKDLDTYLNSMYNHGSDLDYGEPIIFENAKPLEP